MALTAASVGANVSSLANQLFTQLDANNDGRLSTTEFQSFLEGLLQQVDNRRALGAGATVTASADRTYAPMAGFDTGKLNDSSHTTPKYVFARATQDLAIGTDRASRSASLDTIAAYVRDRGFPNAAVVGDDSIDFGDGFGPIDVLTSAGSWWWGPQS
jgi:hypothetical protein